MLVPKLKYNFAKMNFYYLMSVVTTNFYWETIKRDNFLFRRFFA